MFNHSKQSNPARRRVRILGTVAFSFTLSAAVAGVSLAVEPTRTCERGGDRTPDSSRPDRTPDAYKPGLKAAFGFGSLEPSNPQGLQEGDAGFLALGYGADPHATFWLTAIGSEHRQNLDHYDRTGLSDLGGLELSLQYSFERKSKFRPYGRIGVGAYSAEEVKTKDALTGHGLRLGLGADYFLSRHCAVGLEWIGRSAHYSRERLGEDGEFQELPHNLDADASGVIFAVTIQ